ncbi:MAG: hypothetical protein KI790_06020 [Cyclobacteriaceae bacterium]|nr:hypothetical protein [Cyclobacteriaceae bacterium HetDA_MAG_MS6]
MKPILNYISISVFVILTGCVNLTAVNNYSKRSLEALEKFNEIDCSLEEICKESSWYEFYAKDHIRAQIDQGQDFSQLKPDASCKDAAYVDSIYVAGQNSLEAFFKVLVQLSSDDILSIDLESLKTEVEALDKNDEHTEKIDAIATVVEEIFSIGIDIKRKKKIKEVFGKVQPQIKVILLGLHEYIDNHKRDNLERLKLLTTDFYQNAIDNDLPAEVKIMLDKEFQEKLKDIAKIEEQMDLYLKIIMEIVDGTDRLNLTLSNKELLDTFKNYYQKVSALKTAFESIN